MSGDIREYPVCKFHRDNGPEMVRGGVTLAKVSK